MKPITPALMLSTLLAGCATPTIQYGYFHEGATRTEVAGYSDTYMLPKTVLTLESTPPKAPADEPGKDNAKKKGDEKAKAKAGNPSPKLVAYTLKLRRQEDTTQSFAISPYNRYGVTTTVALAKVENTQLIQSATVSVEDKRKEYIASAFKILTSVVGIGAPVAAPSAAGISPQLPIDIDTLASLKANKCGRKECEFAALSDQVDGITAWMEVGALPPDAMEIDTFITQLAKADGVLASSACRQASIRIDMPEGMDDLVSHFSLADPRYVQLIGLPAKGTITAHSECGYSVLPEDAELVPNIDVADSFLSELIKLAAAYEKSKEDDEKDKE